MVHAVERQWYIKMWWIIYSVQQ